jgi:hypothetical protein
MVISAFLLCVFGPSISATEDDAVTANTPGTPANPMATIVNNVHAAQLKEAIVTNPTWMELTPLQQQALAPLAVEWDTIDAVRKKKWLAIGNKFASMKPAEQQRIQKRMRQWIELTPEQRRIARNSYVRAKKLNPEQKSAQWQQYQQLSEEQKKKLAADAASKRHVANLPSPKSRNKTLPSIKSTPKPTLKKSVTPQATSQSALQPTVPPAEK